MSKLVRDYVEQANLGKSGACHMLRHTMATLMLENGADIRYIQEMLGHSELAEHADLHASLHPAAEANPLGHASRRDRSKRKSPPAAAPHHATTKNRGERTC